MGLILDSSILIAAERKGKNARNALAEIALQAAGEDVAVSVVTLMELAHGIARANTPERKATRQQFLNELIAAVPVHPVQKARYGGAPSRSDRRRERRAGRFRLALSDLLIGVTALDSGYRVATGNVRHFEMVPGLEVVSF